MNPRRLLAAAVALSLAGGVGALALRRLDRSRPVSVDEAVDRFREADASATARPTASATAAPAATPSARTTASGAPSTAPTNGPGMTGRTRTGSSASPAAGGDDVMPATPPGVYVYATTGYETADAGVNARHDYPAQTTVTVRAVPCGSSVRWDATEDRWDDVTICAQGDVTRVTAYASYHRFFGHAQEHDYRCGGTNYLRPPSPRAGSRWSFDCTTADARARTVATVVGVEKVGEDDALHVHYETTLTGSSRGSNPQDFWLALDGPYVLRQASRVDADVDTPFGTIRYHEQYDLRLTSRTPRR